MNTTPIQGAGAGALPFAQPSQELGKDDFLQLLVAKLTNQDPLSPSQDTQFVAELATFSSLEQLMEANRRLDGLALGQSELINSQTLELIGKRALVESDGTLEVRGGEADEVVVVLPEAIRDGRVIVRDADGNVVREIELERGAEGRITIDLDANGRQQPLADGDYTLEVEALGTDGETMTVGLFRMLKIDAIDFANGLIRLVSGDRIIGFDQILEIHDGPATASDR